MAGIHITDIESAINYWRDKKPASADSSLAPETSALAEVYARMVFRRELETEEFSISLDAMLAWLAWYGTTPDTPCIAICSTSQGDQECKGCGRSFSEVQLWTQMRPAEKRQIWRRISLEARALRFNKYAERVSKGPYFQRSGSMSTLSEPSPSINTPS